MCWTVTSAGALEYCHYPAADAQNSSSVAHLYEHAQENCPSWIKEKEIQKVKCLKRVNYADARKKVEKLPIFQFEKSFAAVPLSG